MIDIIKEKQNLEHFELYPQIVVYRNLLPDIKNLYDIMNDSSLNSNGQYYLKEWTQWAHFGTYTQPRSEGEPGSTSGEMYDKEKYLVDSVKEAYHKAISDYIMKYNIDLPESSRVMGGSFSKYNENIDHMKNNLTMQYHTDFIICEKDMPGPKFLITCTMYINDDYDGGEIEFFINGDVVTHKPKAGDIVIFPSGEPYYHSVKTIKNGQKLLVRNFIVYEYEGSKEWLQKQKQIGAYRWAQMEFERIEKESPTNMLYVKNGKKITYEEAINDYESRNVRY